MVRNFRFGLILGLLILLFVWSPVFMQGRVNEMGTGGIHTIRGRVFLPNGKSPDLPVTVKLESSNFSTVTVNTDQNGAFVFRALAPGNYSVVVDGLEGVETAREFVTIDPEIQVPSSRLVTPKIFNIPIYLRPKANHGEAEQTGVIDARLSGVPQEALKHFEKANDLVRNKQNGSAVTEYQQAVSIYPQFTLALIELGRLHLILGKLEPAISSFAAALKLEPKNFEATLGYGISLLNKKETGNAQKLLKEAIELNQKAVTPHYYLGLVYIQKKEIDEARKELETAKKMKSENDFPLVHYYLGGIYWNKKEYKLAADELEKYLALVPNASDAEKIKETIATLRNKQD